MSGNLMCRINGKEEAVFAGTTVSQLCAQKKLACDRVVVEVNRAIVPRESFDTCVLASGDTVEILHFVGGG